MTTLLMKTNNNALSLAPIPGVLALIVLFSTTLIWAVPVGPKLPSESPNAFSSNAGKPLPKRLDIPDLDIAVVVLDPNLDEEDQKMREKGVWPEVRKTESIRSAHQIKQALVDLNQFERVLVAPSTSVSSDLYLEGKIENSTTEKMMIRWRLLDARGATWIKWKDTDHRVELGWHQRYYKPGIDAFGPLYRSIANDVRLRLNKFAAEHSRIQKRNEKNSRRNSAPVISELQEITLVRDLVMARFFVPSVYQDTLELNRKDQWEINYLPNTQTREWLRVQSFARRDQDVAAQYDTKYREFFEKVNPSYEGWLEDVYPFARDARKRKNRARSSMVLGTLALLATAAAGVDASDGGVQDRILVGGGLIGGALLTKGLLDRQSYKKNLGLFDEKSAEYHDEFMPLNVNIEGDIHTLTGTAQEQFSRWRQLIKETYDMAESDSFDIEIVDTTP